MTSPELSVVMPCYNEGEAVEKIVRDWSKELTENGISHEFVMINDGSMDGTGRSLDRVRKEIKDVRVVHQLNTGHGRAVRRGYEMSRGQYVLQVDPSGRFEFSDFMNLWEARKGATLVLGQRTHRLDAFFRRFLSWTLRKSARLIFGVQIQDPNVPFRLFLRNTLQESLTYVPKHFQSVNLSLALLIASDPAKTVVEVRVPYRKRPFGKTKTGLGKLLSLSSSLLTEMVVVRWHQWRRSRLLVESPASS